jgi:hypothetical protein
MLFAQRITLNRDSEKQQIKDGVENLIHKFVTPILAVFSLCNLISMEGNATYGLPKVLHCIVQ